MRIYLWVLGTCDVAELPIPILKYILSISQATADVCTCPSIPRSSSGIFQRCFGSKWGKEAWSKHFTLIKMPALVQLCLAISMFPAPLKSPAQISAAVTVVMTQGLNLSGNHAYPAEWDLLIAR